jgi:hypothetical protein
MDENRVLFLTKNFLAFLKHVETPSEKYKAVISGIETIEEDGVIRDVALDGTVWIFNYAKGDLDDALLLINKIDLLAASGVSLSSLLDEEISSLEIQP